MNSVMDYEKMGDNTFKAAKLLIKNVLMIQGIEHINKLRYESPKHFLKEYATVKVCGPRHSGHSSCIPRIIFKYRLNPLVISYNQAISSVLVNNYFNNLPKGVEIVRRTKSDMVCSSCHNGGFCDFSINFSSINSLLNGMLRGLTFDSIIVDTASMLKSDQIEGVYDYFVTSMSSMSVESHPLVIFLE